jgi:hypothetical protein
VSTAAVSRALHSTQSAPPWGEEGRRGEEGEEERRHAARQCVVQC